MGWEGGFFVSLVGGGGWGGGEDNERGGDGGGGVVECGGVDQVFEEPLFGALGGGGEGGVLEGEDCGEVGLEEVDLLGGGNVWGEDDVECWWEERKWVVECY